MKNERNRYRTNLTGGINQEIDNARENECADARNVWAPNGFIERRPGYVGYYPLLWVADSATVSGSATVTTTGTFSSSVVQKYTYVGFTISDGTSLSDIRFLDTSNTNSNPTLFKAEYSLGDGKWRALPVNLLVQTTDLTANGLLYTLDGQRDLFEGAAAFLPPGDWATDTVSGNTRYWIRFALANADYSGSAPSSLTVWKRDSVEESPKFLLPLPFQSGTQYAGIGAAYPALAFVLAKDLHGSKVQHFVLSSATGITEAVNFVLADAPTVAVVNQFDEAYIAYNYDVFTATPLTVTDTVDSSDVEDVVATVESSDVFIGPGAPFDQDTIPLEGTFPATKFISFFRGRLWAANMANEPNTVRWSAAVPFHKVWPASAAESLIDNSDNSDITGMAPLGEHMVVYKRNSIWLMVFTDIDVFGVARYTPTKVISGIGCVSNSSIQQIRGTHVFLSDSGIYQFDGTNVRKVTETRGYDRLRQFMRTTVRDSRATAVHWRSKGCYLLALPRYDSVDSNSKGVNDHVVVWDYVHDTFWIWDNFKVSCWLHVNDDSQDDKIYFVDNYGGLYELGGTTDHGAAISSYATTQRIGYETNNAWLLRDVTVVSDTTSNSMTVGIISDDSSLSVDGTLTLTDANDAVYGSATWGTSTYVDKAVRVEALNFREVGYFHQVKISNSTKNQPFKIRNVDVGIAPYSRRA